MCQDKTLPLKRLVPDQARTWIGTDFRHQGRSKKNKKFNGGTDCIGLVVGVATELGVTNGKGQLLKDLDQTNYSKLGMGNKLVDILDKNMDKVDFILPGDVLLFRLMGQPQHVGIVGIREGELSLIHSYQGHNKVVEHHLSDKWLNRIISIYRFRE